MSRAVAQQLSICFSGIGKYDNSIFIIFYHYGNIILLKLYGNPRLDVISCTKYYNLSDLYATLKRN